MIILINRITVVGTVSGRGAECRYTPNGKCVLTYSVGLKRLFKNQQGEYDWDNVLVEVWGKLAEYNADRVKPKSICAASGRLQMDRWEKDGVRHSMPKIVADEMKVIGGNSGSDFQEVEMSDDYVPFS